MTPRSSHTFFDRKRSESPEQKIDIPGTCNSVPASVVPTPNVSRNYSFSVSSSSDNHEDSEIINHTSYRKKWCSIL